MPPVRKIKPEPTPVAATSPRVVSGQLDKKIKKQQLRKKKIPEKRGIVFIKHLPHGFFEEQLKNYFQQFGRVTRLRLSRSRRTGGSKGFAFVEFEYPEVAQVAAETMDNYLMFKKLIKASYIPPEKQHFNYFKTTVRKVTNKAGKDIYVSGKTAAIQRKVKEYNNWSDESYQKRTAKSLQRLNKLNQKYAHLGIDFTKLAILPQKVEEGNKVKKSEIELEADSGATTTSKRKVAIKLQQKGQTKIAEKPEKLLKKKVKKDIELVDLLGNTINDDSEDGDYIAMPESDEELKQSDSNSEDDVDEGDDDDDDDDDGEDEDDEDDTSSDEETYGFTRDSDSDVNIKASKHSRDVKKSKTTFGKMAKPSKVDRFEQLIKRKSHTGAIRKAKKALKPVVAKKGKSSVQIAAAKEMAKTMKSKPNLSVKLTKKSKIKK